MPNFTFPFCQPVLRSAILVFGHLATIGCDGTTGFSEIETSAASISERSSLEQRATEFCGNCHAMPPPQSFPKDAWYEEVERGYEFYFKTGRRDLHPPAMIEVVNYFRDKAPDQLKLTTPVQSEVPFERRFVPIAIDLVESTSTPAVSHIKILPKGNDIGDLLFCDARGGDLRSIWTSRPNVVGNSMVQLRNPSHAEPTDLDGNGIVDFVIADMGSIYPADHDQGRLVWLRSNDGKTEWTSVVLNDRLGRVADVRAGDFDGDGKLDLIVAVFGWHATGEILYLKNSGLQDGQPTFHVECIDSRHGTIHLPTCDLNQDGKLDFIALVSQEYEVVEAFLNNGDGTFARQPIFSANDPGFGSSGIEVVDFDQDGDLDVLYTSGDSFDSKYLKPNHGVYWLENAGAFPFRTHLLVQLPGAYRALAADFDNDRDLDIVASAFIPRSQISNAAVLELTSLLLLEQIEQRQFRIHVIERGKPRHAAVEIIDADKDGDFDIVTGQYCSDESDGKSRLFVWRNEMNQGG